MNQSLEEEFGMKVWGLSQSYSINPWDFVNGKEFKYDKWLDTLFGQMDIETVGLFQKSLANSAKEKAVKKIEQKLQARKDQLLRCEICGNELKEFLIASLVDGERDHILGGCTECGKEDRILFIPKYRKECSVH